MKKVAGWILFVWGLLGIVANLVAVFIFNSASWMLVGNTIVCLIFIFGGWYLSHPKKTDSGAIRNFRQPR